LVFALENTRVGLGNGTAGKKCGIKKSDVGNEFTRLRRPRRKIHIVLPKKRCNR